jgi:hypothetical protein
VRQKPRPGWCSTLVDAVLDSSDDDLGALKVYLVLTALCILVLLVVR